MGWVDGKPKMVSERYLGSAAEIEALLDAREQAIVPDRIRHLDFGAVAAVWGLLSDLGVTAVIDEAGGPAPSGLPLSVGTYLALAVLNRVVDPCSKRGFADWWKKTAADRFIKIPAAALDHRRFWDAMHALPLDALAGIEQTLALTACARFGLDTSSVALDMTNFATFIDTGNDKAPIAQRGKAKQKRSDLRLVGLGLVVTREGGIPLLSHAYPGNKPDVTQFPDMIATLAARHAALAAAAGGAGTALAKAGRHLDELAATLARGATRRPRATVKAEIATITRNTWVRRVITWQLTGDKPRDLRLSWAIDHDARTALEEEIFGKHVLITAHDDWPVADVIAAYRSQSEAESSFRQMKDPHVVSFSPMYHWTEHNIRVHTFTCVLALQIAHLMRLNADRAGLHLSVRELLAQLGGIGETVLIYPSTGGRPKARRKLTETTDLQDQLAAIFHLDRWEPAVRS